LLVSGRSLLPGPRAKRCQRGSLCWPERGSCSPRPWATWAGASGRVCKPASRLRLVATMASMLLDKLQNADSSKLVRDLKDTGLRKALEQEGHAKLLGLLSGTLQCDTQSLGWLEVLHVLRNKKEAFHEFNSAAAHFLNECNSEHIRHSPEKFCDVAAQFAENHTVKSGPKPLDCLAPLLKAVQKLRTTEEHLTPIHGEYVKMCLVAKCYHAAVRVLDEDILYIPAKEDRKSHYFKIEHLLLYHYYGGMVYIGLKRFDRALQFLSVSVTAPADCLSLIMIEAYKKYVLVCLLEHGALVPLPSYASNLTRQFKNATQPYQDFHAAYKKGVVAELDGVMAKYSETLESDKNLGLARQCLAKLTRRNIKRLTETFLTLSLEDIAKRVNLATAQDAESALVGMIADREIFATINQLTGTVSFHDDPEKYDTEATTRQLQDEMRSAAALYGKVMELDKEVRTNPRYVKKMSPNQEGGNTNSLLGDMDQGGMGSMGSMGMGP